ncbi:hypothetical protein ACQRWP_16275 [Micromonospora trifolii]|uniref:hypothetical protein n=1 Tax=Micromonospora trifolii TaxID=2911208 RepID=UPI003D2F13FA
MPSRRDPVTRSGRLCTERTAEIVLRGLTWWRWTKAAIGGEVEHLKFLEEHDLPLTRRGASPSVTPLAQLDGDPRRAADHLVGPELVRDMVTS